ncbi:SDR family NAD(P)-dependent oxidoreductase [Duganella aceris]|uniref:SDR family oxidoreductase n=1 Tax=Duganella aceris TaxID=2703883 RepID=A0ABX0FKH5_9BURK|nr:SDR family oxidoreductase [Duganella aceris]NGZ85075.1 SDR family oxidoreductase [Duganella aceris]
MIDIKKKWALVTGASSGIGAEFARLLAQRGANLVLAARSTPAMETLANELRSLHGVDIVVEPIDLAQSGAASELSRRLARQGIVIDILINNAGFGVFGDFHQQPIERTLEMLQLNITSLTELTHLFAAQMADRGGGHILLVASILGYQATPGYAAYAASKAYVLQFGEALHVELASRNVCITVLSPGVTQTAFLSVSGQASTRFQRVMMMAPHAVAAEGLAALLARRTVIMPGFANRLMTLMNRIAPRALQSRIAGFLMTH